MLSIRQPWAWLIIEGHKDIEVHRSQVAAMTDVVQTMLTTANICVDHGHLADACDKEESGAVESVID